MRFTKKNSQQWANNNKLATGLGETTIYKNQLSTIGMQKLINSNRFAKIN